MNHLDFILWVCLWPVAVSFDAYLVAKRKAITQEEHEHNIGASGSYFFLFVVWVVVALILFNGN